MRPFPRASSGQREGDADRRIVERVNASHAAAPFYTFTTTTNRVVHTTTFDDGRIHGNLVQTGSFSLSPFPAQSADLYGEGHPPQ